MSKSARKERAKKNAKEAVKQRAIADMTERERSIYRLGLSDGKKQGALGEKKGEYPRDC